MTVHSCAVADCTSSSCPKDGKYPRMNGVKGWAAFPSKLTQPGRRKLWETRCKRAVRWKATVHSRICSLHFREWTAKGPSRSHPDPECFAYNGWGIKPTPRRKNRLQRIKASTPLVLPRKVTNTDENLVASDADADTGASSAATPARSEHYIDDSCVYTLIADVFTVVRPGTPATKLFTLPSFVIQFISGALSVAQNVEISNSQNFNAQGGTPQLHAEGPPSQSGDVKTTPSYDSALAVDQDVESSNSQNLKAQGGTPQLYTEGPPSQSGDVKSIPSYDGAGTHAAVIATPSPSADHCYSQTSRPLTDEGGELADAGVQTCSTMSQTERDRVFLEAFKDKVLASDESVRKYTGMRTRKLLFDIFSLIDECITVQYWRGRTNPLDIAQGRKRPGGGRSKLSKFDEYLMTLIYVKEELPLHWLSDIFGLSCSTVRYIIITWINLLHQVFGKYLGDLCPETFHIPLPECYPLQIKDAQIILNHVLNL